jgi:hypothetical protein
MVNGTSIQTHYDIVVDNPDEDGEVYIDVTIRHGDGNRAFEGEGFLTIPQFTELVRRLSERLATISSSSNSVVDG